MRTYLTPGVSENGVGQQNLRQLFVLLSAKLQADLSFPEWKPPFVGLPKDPFVLTMLLRSQPYFLLPPYTTIYNFSPSVPFSPLVSLKKGGSLLPTVELACLQLSFFAYSPLRRLLDALSHCKKKKLRL